MWVKIHHSFYFGHESLRCFDHLIVCCRCAPRTLQGKGQPSSRALRLAAMVSMPGQTKPPLSSRRPAAFSKMPMQTPSGSSLTRGSTLSRRQGRRTHQLLLTGQRALKAEGPHLISHRAVELMDRGTLVEGTSSLSTTPNILQAMRLQSLAWAGEVGVGVGVRTPAGGRHRPPVWLQLAQERLR